MTFGLSGLLVGSIFNVATIRGLQRFADALGVVRDIL